MLVIFVLLMLWGFYTYSLRKTGGQVEFKYTYENPSYFNGLIFTLYSAYFAFQLDHSHLGFHPGRNPDCG